MHRSSFHPLFLAVLVSLLAACTPAGAVTAGNKTLLARQRLALDTGISLSYIEAGNPDGPVVIMLPGYTDTSRSFLPVIEALVDQKTALHVYALDLRGHGASSMPGDAVCAAAPEQCFEMSDFAADVIAFMDRRNIRKAHIVGHSMGAMVAQELGLAHADRIESIVLMGAVADATNNPVVQQYLVPLIEETWRTALATREHFAWPRDAYLLTPRDADPDADAWMAQNWVVDPVANPAFLMEVVPETAGTRLGTWIGALRNIARFDNSERLQKLAVPALVIWATQDNFFPEPDQAAIRAALDAAVDGCRTRYVFKIYGKAPLPESGANEKDFGHNTHWGSYETTAADITAWVMTSGPTADLPYADPADARHVLVEEGTASLLVKEPPAHCKP